MTIEDNVLELESLGHNSEDYGVPIVCIMLDKSPSSVEAALARQHNPDEEWTLDQFREALKREINILEASGQFDEFKQRAARFKTPHQLEQTSSTMLAVSASTSRSCVYCESNTNKSVQCSSVVKPHKQRKIVSKKMF